MIPEEQKQSEHVWDERVVELMDEREPVMLEMACYPDLFKDLSENLSIETMSEAMSVLMSCGRRVLLRQLWHGGLVPIRMWLRRFHELPEKALELQYDLAMVLAQEVDSRDPFREKRARQGLQELAECLGDVFDYEQSSALDIQLHLSEVLSQ